MPNLLNVPNRTLYHGDNLDFMRALNSESIGLIATDPPFNKGRDFHATPDSLAAGAKFEDRWSWKEDVHPAWKEQIQDDWPALWFVIEAAETAHSPGMGAFLCWLAVRVLEMHRILRDDGSLYLHCDHTAGAYIKTMLDAVFGKENFRNEIVWCYTRMSAGGQRILSRAHDSILWYSRSKNWVFNVDSIRLPYAKASKAREGQTLYRLGSGVSKEGKTVLNPLGKFPEDWIVHIPYLRGKERTGWPTQKPLALYERIIKASSNEGDIVLDPFCGCATTCVAAERLRRNWVGCDIWDKAYEAMLVRLHREGLNPGSTEAKLSHKELAEHMDVDNQVLIWFNEYNVNYTRDLPARTDDGAVAAPYLAPQWRSKKVTPGAEDESARWSNAKKKAYLVERTGGHVCWGCGRTFDHEAYLELDHINPRAGGGANSVYNRALLCKPCNGRKGAHLTLVALRKQNKKDGFMIAEIQQPTIPLIHP